MHIRVYGQILKGITGAFGGLLAFAIEKLDG